MKKLKFINLLLLLIAIFSFTACNSRNDTSTSTFPGIDDANIPDVLKITVGKLGDISYSDGINDAPDYKSVLNVTFEGTTKADYDTLMEHYQSTSTGVDENNELLFDWGKLQVSPNNGSITITALINK